MQVLLNIGFKIPDIDRCVFYWGDIILKNADYGCFLIPSSKSVERYISDLKDTKNCQCDFDLEERGDISDCLGINFAKTKDDNLKLTYPQLIYLIISKVVVDIIRRRNPMTEVSTKKPHQDIKSETFDYPFNYFL